MVTKFSPNLTSSSPQPIGYWQGADSELTDRSVSPSETPLDQPCLVLGDSAEVRTLALNQPLALAASGGVPVLAVLPALGPTSLGDPQFCQAYGLRYAYMTGAMANGIASAELVIAAAQAGCLGSYGAGGQSLAAITTAIETIQAALTAGETYAVNLIHSPGEPEHEEAVVDLLLAKQVRVIEASAYLGLTKAVVRYRLQGLHENDGAVVVPNKIIAKASRMEVATRWLSPPPAKMVAELLQAGAITADEARLASRICMADDLTAESDSGGHTDNRPALCMLPTFLALRDRLAAEHGCDPIRIGLGGGIATPQSIAAALSMGAAYVVTGSINQACVEAGSCTTVRTMLAEAEQADVAMAPAADMFEMGVKLQVLKRGTMFPMRAQKLYDLYKDHASWQDIPQRDRDQVEKQILRTSFSAIWQECEQFWQRREAKVLQKAQQDPKAQMALVFRWYLGMASRWANTGKASRVMDYQVWAGPAMGAFNEWTRGSYLADPEARTVANVAHNLMHATARHLRNHALIQLGVVIPQPTPAPVRTEQLGL